MIVYALLGIFRDEKFSYARTAIVPEATFSILSSKIAFELNCIEKLEKPFKSYFPYIGNIDIDSVCIVDKAIIDGGLIETKTVFHIVPPEALSDCQCEAILGRDIILWWKLVYDRFSGKVRSLIAKPIQ